MEENVINAEDGTFEFSRAVYSVDYENRKRIFMEKRELRRNETKPFHGYFINHLAAITNITPDDVHELLLDNFEEWGDIEKFCVDPESTVLIFNVCVMDPPPLECGRVFPDNKPMKRIFINNKKFLQGLIVIFAKFNEGVKLADERNIDDELYVHTLHNDTTNMEMLSGIGLIFRSIFMPLCTKQRIQRIIDKTDVENFSPLCEKQIYDALDNVSQAISVVQSSLKATIQLVSVPSSVASENEHYINVGNIMKLAKNPIIVKDCEHTVSEWIDQVQYIINNVEQVRNDSCDGGIRDEIHFWRKFSIIFSSALEQISQHQRRAVLYILYAGNSGKLFEWHAVEKRLLEKVCETRDNLKYLLSLSRSSEPLLQGDATTINEYIPGIMSAVKLLHHCSDYYKNPNAINSLILKISTQVTICAKKYLLPDTINDIRKIDLPVLQSKISEIKRLLDTYTYHYNEFVSNVDTFKSEFAETSSNYVLRPIKALYFRLSRILSVYDAIGIYSGLNYVKYISTADTIDVINKSKNEFDTLESDLLNENDQRFDEWYSKFISRLDTIDKLLECSLYDELNNIFNNRHRGACEAIFAVKQLETVKLPFFKNLYVRAYNLIAEYYYKIELDTLFDEYKEFHVQPPIHPLNPPAASHIAWARNLYKRASEPLRLLIDVGYLKTGKRDEQLLHKYERLVKTFVTHELVVHRHWLNSVNNIINCLKTPIFIRTDTSGTYYTNFDPFLECAYHCCKIFRKLDLKVPRICEFLMDEWSQLRASYYRSNAVIELYENNCARIKSRIYYNAALFLIQNADKIMNAGLTHYCWLSVGLSDFFKNCESYLIHLQTFFKQVESLIKYRIHGPLNRIHVMRVADFIGQKNFLKNLPTLIYNETIRVAKELNKNGIILEHAVWTLIKMFIKKSNYPGVKIEPEVKEVEFGRMTNMQRLAVQTFVNTPHQGATDWSMMGNISRAAVGDEKLFSKHCLYIWSYFEQRLVNAIIFTLKKTLSQFRDCIMRKLKYVRQTNQTIFDSVLEEPVFLVNLSLDFDEVDFSPPLDELQDAINKVATYIMDIAKAVRRWGQLKNVNPDEIHDPDDNEQDFTDMSTVETRRKLKKVLFKEKINTYYNEIRENIGLVRIIEDLAVAMPNQKQYLMDAINEFYVYEEIWKDEQPLQTSNEQKDLSESINEIDFDVNEKEDTVDEQFNFACCIGEFYKIEKLFDKVKSMKSHKNVFPFKILTKEFAKKLRSLLRARELNFGTRVHTHMRERLFEISDFIQQIKPRISRTVEDLNDLKIVLSSIQITQDIAPKIEKNLPKIELAYQILMSHNIPIPKSEFDLSETIMQKFDALTKDAIKAEQDLLEILEPFKEKFVQQIADFVDESEEFIQEYMEKGPLVKDITSNEASDRLRLFQSQFEVVWHKYQMLYEGEIIFGLPHLKLQKLLDLRKELTYLNRLYSLYELVTETMKRYNNLPWKKIKTQTMLDEVSDLLGRCKRLPKSLKQWNAFAELTGLIDDFMERLPLIELMVNDAVQSRHWRSLEQLFGVKFPNEDEAFQLSHVMSVNLPQHKEEVEDICITAMKEKEIESKLEALEQEWRNKDLVLTNFKSRGEILLKGQEMTDILSLIDESNVILSGLASNRYNAFFKNSINAFVSKLVVAYEVITKWMQVQNLWVYLESVFIDGDISRQLPVEARRFINVDKTWLKMIGRAKESPNVISCCTSYENNLELLNFMLEQLEICQASLTGYLESKRKIFPRLYFLSDPVLLEILGQASDPLKLKPYFSSFTESVSTVDFNHPQNDSIIAFKSEDNEKLDLVKQVSVMYPVEDWLGNFLRCHQLTVKNKIKQCIIVMGSSDFSLYEFFAKEYQQFALIILQLIWTANVEHALKELQTDKTALVRAGRYFQHLLNHLIDQTVKPLSKYDRRKYETLITIHIHQRDVFVEHIQNKIRSVNDFDWLKQCRYYFDDNSEEMVISITNVDFVYSNEFLSCSERLVITPLTDRCYISLAQAFKMCYGGSPAGPAGTGKTETTKDMARAIGKYCVVLNCSDQFDFKGLGKTYKGLAQSGSWGCFDEFNRINLPVLSVAAQQIQTLLQAKREHASTFVFTDGETVSLDPTFAIIITMNPGYAGRQELPENLKINFRVIAMMVPDRQIIIRVKLASSGFVDNIVLSQKFYLLYKLCEDQLSKQVHYDFGLRNILAVLRTLGTAKRSRPEESETSAVLRVLRDMNISKLVDEDEPLFMSLLNDLFPNITLSSESNIILQQAIEKKVEEFGLTNHPAWNLKVVQLYETQLVRHGIMVLGPSGAGKTTCINTLEGALTLMGTPTRNYRMNPKAITSTQMFGALDVVTNDWTDGIFSTIWRRFLKFYELSQAKNAAEAWWMILDGPVDAVWIENLNSVLDDNKLLTLANGDRIPMAPNVKIIFEVHNIDNASPATVSRNGMVFMSTSVLPWRAIAQAWLQKKKGLLKSKFMDVMEPLFDETFKFVTSKLHPTVFLYECNYIKQVLDLIDGIFIDEYNSSDESVVNVILFAFMWSMGALLELNDRTLLQEFLLNQSSKPRFPVLQSSNETIFEYFVNKQGKWQHWKSEVVDWQYPDTSDVEFSKILVPNIDNVRARYLIETIAKQGKAVLLVGEQGTAKTTIIKNYLGTLNQYMNTYKILNFSSVTEPNYVQKTLESYLEKRVANTLGPMENKKMTIFIDDINMPVVNEWGDQIANELVRQVIEFHGFFSIEKPGDWINLIDIQFIGAMIHPGGGRNDIPERLKRQFSIFNCTIPSDTAIDDIFCAIAGYFTAKRGFSKEIIKNIPDVVKITRLLWQSVKTKMLPTPAKFHYVFNLRDLSRIWEGMLRIKHEECETLIDILYLWKHEVTRVLCDRLIEENEVTWFEKRLYELGFEIFHETFDTVSKTEPLWFCNFLREEIEVTDDMPSDISSEELKPKVYERATDIENLKNVLINNMKKMNSEVRGVNLNIVFFEDAIAHVLRISRIISTPKGHGLLVGVGGSGKQSLTKLASFIAGYKIFQISVTRSYNVNSFFDDLRALYKMVGRLDQGVSFIISDNDLIDEHFLEYINNMLSSGEIAGLLSKEENEEIANEMTYHMKKLNPKTQPTNELIQEFYWRRVRKNLHLVLCFSPDHKKFRERALKFPGITSGCTIDWYHRWPLEALISVSAQFLQDFDMSCEPSVKAAVVHLMGEIHNHVSDVCTAFFQRYRRKVHFTPKSFLSFIESYKHYYSNQKQYFDFEKRKMDAGIEKLVEAAEKVNEISEELLAKEKDIQAINEIATAELGKTEGIKKEAEEKSKQVTKIKESAEQLVEKIASQKAVADREMLAAKDVLDECKNALLEITKSDIDYLKKLTNPPPLIMIIIDSILILLKYRVNPITINMNVGGKLPPFYFPTTSETSKMLGHPQIMKLLYELNPDELNDEMLELTGAYFKYPGYTYDAAYKVFKNLAPLTNWAKKMEEYYNKNKVVLPIKETVRKLENKYRKADSKLQKAEAEFIKTNEMLQSCLKEYYKAMEAKNVVQSQYDKLQEKRDTAADLVNKLTDEKKRWSAQSTGFIHSAQKLAGDALIATAFLSYCGPFNQEYRNELKNTWSKFVERENIPHTEKFNVVNSFVDESVIDEWNLEGLPADELSVQNGVIITRGRRYPLLIDPQMQGKKWLKNKEKEMVITTQNARNFRDILEDCLANGKVMLVEDIGEELDPALDNVLDRNYFILGTKLKCRISDKDCDVDPAFKIYITTKIPTPSFSPEASARVSVIDFAVTIHGLEEQLLALTIINEKSELEKERVALAYETSSNKRRLVELEGNLLSKLSSIQGSVLDDPELIAVLSENKSTVTMIKEKMIVAEKTKQKLNAAREEYRGVAIRGSVLYFLITEMSLVNVMYQNSLSQFLGLFHNAMESSKGNLIVSTRQRSEEIVKVLTYIVWAYITRSIYKADRTLFTLLMTLKIKLRSDDIKFSEFTVFIKAGATLDMSSSPAKPFEWISDVMWLNLVQLSHIPRFKNLLKELHDNESAWKKWFNAPSIIDAAVPNPYELLSDFERLLLIRIWAPDRTLIAAQKFIAATLGVAFVQPYILNLEEMLEETNSRTPLLGLLSSGADPTNNIEALAKKLGKEIYIVSMGQGQEVQARMKLEQAMATGSWLILQNCHLGLDYMDEFYECVNFSENIHEDFRVWLTSEVHPDFPVHVLQCSIKFTNEPPQGVRAGLLRTYELINQDLMDSSNTPQWIYLLYGVSFLHSILQERRKYGPIGWNIPYEFSQTDWEASVKYIQNHMIQSELKKSVSWKAIRYMISEIQYGGRVTDDMDRRLLNSYTTEWFGEFMCDPNFRFADKYAIPNTNVFREVVQYISSLPIVDSAPLFGLHANSDITFQTRQAEYTLSTIVNIQPKQSSGIEGDSRELVVYKIANDMLQKLPKNFTDEEIRKRLSSMGLVEPMSIFLRQELNRMQKLLNLVRCTLTDLKLAIDGIIILSEDLRFVLDSLFDGRVPKVWIRFSWSSSALGFWFTELLQRHEQYEMWLRKGRPKCFWFAGFFNPAGFITAMRQEVTRAHNDWALDFVVVESNVLKIYKDDVHDSPSEGVYIYGLYLEGAGWDLRNRKLCESHNKVLFCAMPVIHLYAVNTKQSKRLEYKAKSSALKLKKKDLHNFTYECPIYKKRERTEANYITSIILSSDGTKPCHWILRGVALLCDIS